jgi:hypothetical protein
VRWEIDWLIKGPFVSAEEINNDDWRRWKHNIEDDIENCLKHMYGRPIPWISIPKGLHSIDTAIIGEIQNDPRQSCSWGCTAG